MNAEVLREIQTLRNIQNWSYIYGNKNFPGIFKIEAKFESELRNGSVNKKTIELFEENFQNVLDDDALASYKYGMELVHCKVLYNKGDQEISLKKFQGIDLVTLESTPRDLILYGDMLIYQASYLLRNIVVSLPPHKSMWNFTKDIIKRNYDKGNALRMYGYQLCHSIEQRSCYKVEDSKELQELACFFHHNKVPVNSSDASIPSIEELNRKLDDNRIWRVAFNDPNLEEGSREMKSKILCGYPIKLGTNVIGQSWRTIISHIRGLLVEGDNQSVTTLNGSFIEVTADDVLHESQFQLVLMKMLFRKEKPGIELIVESNAK